jgi:putative membrane protein
MMVQEFAEVYGDEIYAGRPEGRPGLLMCGMMWGTGGMGGVWMVLWVLVGLAVLVLSALALAWVVRTLAGGGQGGGDPAEQELRRRYAAGEISRDQYLAMSSDLHIPRA